VLFADGQANVAGTLDRLAEIAAVHADAGADLLIPSGMLDGSVRALRAAVSSAGRPELPIAAMVKLQSVLYAAHRIAVEAIPVTERAVPLVAVDDRDGARARAMREVAAGADAVVLKPGLVTLDLVTRVSESVDRPVISFFTADEHAFFTSPDDSRGLEEAERETFSAARRAGADLLISYGALSATSE
jgi:porphobilinogen synthase